MSFTVNLQQYIEKKTKSRIMERRTGEAYVQQQTSYGGYDDDNYDERHAEESVIAKIHLQKFIYQHILDEE